MAKETITSGAGVFWSAIVTKLNNMFTELYGKLLGLVMISNNIVLSSVVSPAVAPTVTVSATAGLLNGATSYSVTFYTATGETNAIATSTTVTPVLKQVDITGIPVSMDSTVVGRRIYRLPVGAADPVLKKLVVDIADNTTTIYTDNIPDASLGLSLPHINTTGGDVYVNSTRVASISSFSMAVGPWAMIANTGYAVTAVGPYALNANTTGYRNTAVGVFASYRNTTGARNTTVGVHAGDNAVTANDVTAIGYAALMKNQSSNNTAVGSSSLQECTTGTGNTAVGVASHSLGTTASNNCAVGHQSLQMITTGLDDSGFGYQALQALTTGNFNTAVGMQAVKNSTTAGGNTGIGFQALFTANAGENVGIGRGSGYYETGAGKLYIDNTKRTNESDGRLKAMMYGVFAVATEDQYLTVNANLTWRPKALITPDNIGELTFEATSNTSLTIKLKGSDGTVRSAILTLA